jgi:predicted enzyme related to lactoylglutathione lyase
MAKALGIGGVFFKSQNPKALCNWYKECLKLNIAKDFDGCIFDKSGLPENAYSVWSPFDNSTEYFNPSEQSFMINFIVDDIDGVLSQVKANGGTIIGKPEDTEFGKFAWMLDPDGNKIELWKPIQS